MKTVAGTRLRSVVCTTEVIVVRATAGDVDVRCGGLGMVPIDQQTPAGSLDPAHSGGTGLGKRYVDSDGALELLCTKAGEGSLAVGDEPMVLKEAKPLPSSD